MIATNTKLQITIQWYKTGAFQIFGVAMLMNYL
jgi:hypothetical protein